MSKMIQKFVKNQDGVTLIEYGLIAALVAVALVGALQGLEGDLSSLFNDVGDDLNPPAS